MSEIAAKNLQEKNTYDPENLWHYPTELYNPGWCVMPFKVKYWQMMRFASNWLGGSDAYNSCQFTENSITGRYAGGYMPSIIPDLKPGKYEISFESSYNSVGLFLFTQFILNNGYAKPGGVSAKSSYFTLGKNSIEFEVLDECCVMMQFKDQGDVQNWITLTDIKIREGIF